VCILSLRKPVDGSNFETGTIILQMRLFSTISPFNLLPGVILYCFWLLSNSLTTTAFLLVVSLANFILYLLPYSPRQLFFSNRSILSRTPHARVRSINSSARTWRASIANGLVGSAAPLPSEGEIIEISVWQRKELFEGILIVFSPMTAGLRLLPGLPGAALVIGPVGVALFLAVLVDQFVLGIEDQRILGQELFKTQRNAVQRKVDESAFEAYAGQVLKRRANYREDMPEYGPGADLRGCFDWREQERESESESEQVARRPRQSAQAGPWSRRLWR
jgi:hypothetical protein